MPKPTVSKEAAAKLEADDKTFEAIGKKIGLKKELLYTSIKKNAKAVKAGVPFITN
jgi:hypothetical protein